MSNNNSGGMRAPGQKPSRALKGLASGGPCLRHAQSGQCPVEALKRPPPARHPRSAPAMTSMPAPVHLHRGAAWRGCEHQGRIGEIGAEQAQGIGLHPRCGAAAVRRRRACPDTTPIQSSASRRLRALRPAGRAPAAAPPCRPRAAHAPWFAGRCCGCAGTTGCRGSPATSPRSIGGVTSTVAGSACVAGLRNGSGRSIAVPTKLERSRNWVGGAACAAPRGIPSETVHGSARPPMAAASPCCYPPWRARHRCRRSPAGRPRRPASGRARADRRAATARPGQTGVAHLQALGDEAPGGRSARCPGRPRTPGPSASPPAARRPAPRCRRSAAVARRGTAAAACGNRHPRRPLRARHPSSARTRAAAGCCATSRASSPASPVARASTDSSAWPKRGMPAFSTGMDTPRRPAPTRVKPSAWKRSAASTSSAAGQSRWNFSKPSSIRASMRNRPAPAALRRVSERPVAQVAGDDRVHVAQASALQRGGVQPGDGRLRHEVVDPEARRRLDRRFADVGGDVQARARRRRKPIPPRASTFRSRPSMASPGVCTVQPSASCQATASPSRVNAWTTPKPAANRRPPPPGSNRSRMPLASATRSPDTPRMPGCCRPARNEAAHARTRLSPRRVRR